MSQEGTKIPSEESKPARNNFSWQRKCTIAKRTNYSYKGLWHKHSKATAIRKARE